MRAPPPLRRDPRKFSADFETLDQHLQGNAMKQGILPLSFTCEPTPATRFETERSAIERWRRSADHARSVQWPLHKERKNKAIIKVRRQYRMVG